MAFFGVLPAFAALLGAVAPALTGIPAQGCGIAGAVDTVASARVAADLEAAFPGWDAKVQSRAGATTNSTIELRRDSLRANIDVSYLLNRAEAATALRCRLMMIPAPRYRPVADLGDEAWVLTEFHLWFRLGHFVVAVNGPTGRPEVEREIARQVAETLRREQAKVAGDPQRPLCRLEISAPGTSGTDTLIVWYVFTDIPFGLASRLVRRDEEVFGHSLVVEPDSAAPLRFARTPFFHYLAFMPPDTVRAGRLEYRFRFPDPTEAARLVDARQWEEAQKAGPGSRVPQQLFERGSARWPRGRFRISAEVELYEVIPGSGRMEAAIRKHRVSCQPVNIQMSP